MICYRLVQKRYGLTRAEAFSGVGASIVDGRWHHKQANIRAVYVARSRALAVLETLVHLRGIRYQPPESFLFTVDLPDEVVTPAPIKLEPPGGMTLGDMKEVGMFFLRNNISVGMEVPSAIVPQESNVLVNVAHPDFRLEWVGEPEEFEYDRRLRDREEPWGDLV